MNARELYRGVWPQNVSKLAKYIVRSVKGEWKVTVLYEAGEGLRHLAVEGGEASLITDINAVKAAVGERPGGPFYVNEYRHVIVPVKSDGESGTGSHYYYACRLNGNFLFEFEEKPLSTSPIRPDGTALKPGDHWVGPRPGIPYVLAAGAGDIYYEMPALTDANPPAVRPNMTRRVRLSKVLGQTQATQAVRPIATVRGHLGGRFYVNEHGAIFTPVGAGDGNGHDYIYCGQIDLALWFPEPSIPAETGS